VRFQNTHGLGTLVIALEEPGVARTNIRLAELYRLTARSDRGGLLLREDIARLSGRSAAINLRSSMRPARARQNECSLQHYTEAETDIRRALANSKRAKQESRDCKWRSAPLWQTHLGNEGWPQFPSCAACLGHLAMRLGRMCPLVIAPPAAVEDERHQSATNNERKEDPER